MRGAGRLYALHLVLGAVGIGLVAAGAIAVISGARLGVPSSSEISEACHSWISAGGPAALLGLGLTALAVTAAVLGIRSARRQIQATAAHLASLPLGTRMEIDGTPCRLLECQEPQAFCAGFVRPEIYVSRGALDRLGEGELRAVVAHERYHRRWRDPLRQVLGRALADALFFIPVLRRTSDRYGILGELAADEAAIASVRDRRALASALLKFDRRVPTPGVISVAPERVDHLVGDPDASRWQLPRSALFRSAVALFGLGALVLLVWHGIINPTLEIPLLLAAACMFLMVGVPVLLALGAAVLSTRSLRARRA
jgi:hypothetical protein